VLEQNAVRAEDAARAARDLERRAHVVAFAERNLFRREPPLLLLEPPVVQGEQLRLDELGGHLDERLLDELLLRDGDAELRPLTGVRDRTLDACARGADGAPRDPEARLVQAAQGSA